MNPFESETVFLKYVLVLAYPLDSLVPLQLVLVVWIDEANVVPVVNIEVLTHLHRLLMLIKVFQVGVLQLNWSVRFGKMVVIEEADFVKVVFFSILLQVGNLVVHRDHEVEVVRVAIIAVDHEHGLNQHIFILLVVVLGLAILDVHWLIELTQAIDDIGHRSSPPIL